MTRHSSIISARFPLHQPHPLQVNRVLRAGASFRYRCSNSTTALTSMRMYHGLSSAPGSMSWPSSLRRTPSKRPLIRQATAPASTIHAIDGLENASISVLQSALPAAAGATRRDMGVRPHTASQGEISALPHLRRGHRLMHLQGRFDDRHLWRVRE